MTTIFENEQTRVIYCTDLWINEGFSVECDDDFGVECDECYDLECGDHS